MIGTTSRPGAAVHALGPDARRARRGRGWFRISSLALLALALAACRRSDPPRGTQPDPTDARAAGAGPAAAGVRRPDPAPGPDGRPLWFPATDTIAAHVAALAAPALRGRGGGTPDELAAAELVAAWLRDAGAEPAGDDGFVTRFTFQGQHSQNLVGVIRGRDPQAGHVVIGAHYDHLGTDGAAVYHGADDNASGTAGLIAIAAALAHDGQRPRRTVVIVAFGAEEAGLYGSAAYAERPALPLAEAVAMINLDMIGRPAFLTGKDYALARAMVAPDAIGVLTSAGHDALAGLAHAAGALERRPIVAASDFGPIEGLIRPLVEQRGDHASFAARGVPYLWLSTSMHDDYHLPSDTPDKIDPATIATVGRIVVRVVADLPDRAALQPEGAAR